MMKMYAAFMAFCLLAFSSRAQQIVFGDDYAPNVSFVAFGGSVNNLSVDNTQAQAGTASLKINVGTTAYTGGALVISAPVNLSAYTALTFWAKSDNPSYKMNVLGIGNNGAGGLTYEVERTAVDLTANWVKYYIPIPVPSKLTAEVGLFHFAEGAEATAYNVWLDNIQYENVSLTTLGTPTAAIATETITKAVGETFKPNGASSNFTAVCPEGQMKTGTAYFTWVSSNAAAVTMDALGVGTAVAQGSSNITAKLGTIDAAGTLTVNVSAPLGVPTVAAPTPPARPAADVISVFSGAYTDLAATDFNPNWGQTTQVSDVDIAGNPTKRYSNFNYQGMQFSSPINASGMTRLHIDIWTQNCTEFKVFPIVPGQPEQSVTISPALNNWTSTDIDLSQYTIPLNNVIQFKFESVPFGSTTVYWDNLYFHKNTTTSTEGLTGVKSLRAFPNPASEELSLSFSDAGGSRARYSVMNLAGQVLKKGRLSDLEKEGRISLSVADLTGGMYMLKVEDQGASQTIKFVKN
jgi:hypothetical protein